MQPRNATSNSNYKKQTNLKVKKKWVVHGNYHDNQQHHSHHHLHAEWRRNACWLMLLEADLSLLLQASSSSSRVHHSRLNLCCNTSHEFSARASLFFSLSLSLSFMYTIQTAAVIVRATKRFEIIILSLSASLFSLCGKYFSCCIDLREQR